MAEASGFDRIPDVSEDAWKIYRGRMVHHLVRLPLGILIALLPFGYNYSYWQAENRLLLGLKISLVYGLVVPLAVSVCYGVAYAVKTHITVRHRMEMSELPVHFHIALNVVGLMAGVWLAMALNHYLFSTGVRSAVFFTSLIFGGVLIIILSLAQAHSRAQEQAMAYRIEAAEARYHALERQMHPHFLFNALNSLAELIESGQANAAETAYNLSDLYRRILDNSKVKTATLESELEIARRYLELERLRFGERLEYSFDIGADQLDVYVPSLVLQTLVENAVKHGISKSVEGGTIDVTIDRGQNGGYVLKVVNTGPPPRETDPDKYSGTGLRNTQTRLDLLYGRGRSPLSISRDSERTTISFPFSGEKID
ncbi:MAG: histidine kinase [Acidobacteriota bacterium]|nr:MAG: histidine kinase [Acidobacteriota bacterium]